MTCAVCGAQKPNKDFVPRSNVCKACKLNYKNLYWKLHLMEQDKMFDDWIAKIKQVPKDYPTLTEEQWLEVCMHFGGCARCQSSEVDTRGFFISAKLGGRYCDWNIIPLCEKCAGSWDLDKSVFRYTEKKAYNTKNLSYRDCLEKIITYLGGKLDNAISKTETN